MNKRQKAVIISSVICISIWLTAVFAFSAHVTGMIFVNLFNLSILCKERIFLKKHSIKNGSKLKYFVENEPDTIGYGIVQNINIGNGIVEYTLESGVLLTHYWSSDINRDLVIENVSDEEYVLGTLA